jgi:hypothetical protein
MAWPMIGSTGLVKRGAGLADGHVQQADGVGGEDLAGVTGDRQAVVLPADAADLQPGDLVAAQAGEQPRQGERPDEFQRVVAACRGAREVRGLYVQPGVQELGPDVVGDDAGVGADQGADAARDGQCPGRVEPALDPFPFLAVPEERAGSHEEVGLGPRRDRLSRAGSQAVASLDVVAERHPVDRGDPGSAGLPVHWAGSVISGCSAASHRPALATMVRMIARTFGVSGEVACHRSTHKVHAGSAPSMTSMWLRPGRTGSSQCPSSATALWSA